MKAGNEKCLIFRCAELLGKFSFTGKMSQKRDLTQTEKSKIIKYSWEGRNTNAILEIAKLKHDQGTAKCSLGQRGHTKTGGKEKTHVNCKRVKN